MLAASGKSTDPLAKVFFKKKNFFFDAETQVEKAACAGRIEDRQRKRRCK